MHPMYGESGEATLHDTMVVNCLCAYEDFKVALSLLRPLELSADRVALSCFLNNFEVVVPPGAG